MQAVVSTLMDMIYDKTYVCNYPEDPDVSNIVSSIEILPEKAKVVEIYNITSYTLRIGGDIIKDIHITGNIQQVIITIGGNNVFSKEYNNETDITITPFKFGIPLVALRLSDIIVYVVGDSSSLNTTRIYLSTGNRRYLCSNKLTFEDPDVTIEDGEWHQPIYIDAGYEKYSITKHITPGIRSEYHCNYPEDPDVNNIIAEETIYRNLPYNQKDNEYFYDCRHDSDIIKEFILASVIEHITMFISGKKVYNSKIEAGCTTLQPFSFGIPLKAFIYHDLKIMIKAKQNPIIFTKGILLFRKDIWKITDHRLEFDIPDGKTIVFETGFSYVYEEENNQ